MKICHECHFGCTELISSVKSVTSSQLKKSRKIPSLIAANLTSIKQSPLLSGCGHLLLDPN